MIGNNLPEQFEGYPTRELLDMWGGGLPLRISKGTPKKKIGAMSNLLRQYKLAPIFWDDPERFERNREELRDLFNRLGLKLGEKIPARSGEYAGATRLHCRNRNADGTPAEPRPLRAPGR